MKKILMIFLGVVLLFTATGCNKLRYKKIEKKEIQLTEKEALENYKGKRSFETAKTILNEVKDIYSDPDPIYIKLKDKENYEYTVVVEKELPENTKNFIKELVKQLNEETNFNFKVEELKKEDIAKRLKDSKKENTVGFLYFISFKDPKAKELYKTEIDVEGRINGNGEIIKSVLNINFDKISQFAKESDLVQENLEKATILKGFGRLLGLREAESSYLREKTAMYKEYVIFTLLEKFTNLDIENLKAVYTKYPKK